MANPVLGADAVLEIKVDDTYYPALCATDMRYFYTPEFIEKTGPTSGLFSEYDVRLQSWGCTLNGLTKIANDTVLSFFYLLQTSVRRVRQDIRLTFTDDESNSKQITGYAFIGSSEITGPVSGFCEATVELKGTGPFTIADVEPPTPETFDVLSDYWTTTNGLNYITGASAINSYTLDSDTDEILEVAMEGVQYDVVSGTPTAGTRTCQFNTSNDRIVFPSDVVFDGAQRVFVEFKRTT